MKVGSILCPDQLNDNCQDISIRKQPGSERLPKEYRFKGKEVEIFRRGDEIVLREKGAGMTRAFELLAGLGEDFFPKRRKKDVPQKRKSL